MNAVAKTTLSTRMFGCLFRETNYCLCIGNCSNDLLSLLSNDCVCVCVCTCVSKTVFKKNQKGNQRGIGDYYNYNPVQGKTTVLNEQNESHTDSPPSDCGEAASR